MKIIRSATALALALSVCSYALAEDGNSPGGDEAGSQTAPQPAADNKATDSQSQAPADKQEEGKDKDKPAE